MVRRALIFPSISYLLLTATPAVANSDATLIGDESDGSRSVPVHLIPLLDEEGQEIAADDEPLLPFSTRQTCANECHNYEKISAGWHFNADDAEVAPGRPGHPWILVDVGTGSQIPLSYRAWPGTFRPEEVGLTPWQFVQIFGRHMPDGGAGELENLGHPEETIRRLVSGKLEVNCLCCHDGDPAHDQAEYAAQIARQNFRWAAASTSSFTSVSGSAKSMPDTYDYMMPDVLNDPKLVPPKVVYRQYTFDDKKKVFFNIPGEIPDERCYFCHSTKDETKTGPGTWASDEDVHIAAGLSCVDCHRNSIDHNMIRGYVGEMLTSTNPLAAVSSCEGCHLIQENSIRPLAGRFAAPIPKHPGIPVVHFEKLTCTACHSASWPDRKAHRIKTSLAHALGTYNVDKSADVLPSILSPIFAKQPDGRIAPHNLIWPAFWASLNGETVTPAPLQVVRQSIAKIEAADNRSHSGDWLTLTEDRISQCLALLAAQKSVEATPVYICRGKLHRLDAMGNLVITGHEAAQPYLWPIAHDVRPAAQSLGVRGCEDCHSLSAPFFLGEVDVIPPPSSERHAVKQMIQFQHLNPVYMNALAISLRFQTWFIAVTLVCAGILTAVIVIYAFKSLVCIMNTLADKQH